MDQKSKNEIPSHVLTALEDLAFDISDLQELMVGLASSAHELDDPLSASSSHDPIH